ncbi:hypothetical protein PanWU01x14_094700 [Parasponia andersonii]|uniref:Reverse transcriptase n=1 Tax=Parasponia andersonii TaxID=3476 RepID=A0A2P5D5C2_PARAD|nr:hypothetical protein PanWU01x14_094700 [Parasponia andersonii]
MKEEILWKQKSRVNWLCKGDRCTRLFFMTAMARRRRNLIHYIKDDDGRWLDERKVVGDALTRKFQTLFSSQESTCPPDLNGLQLPKIKPEAWNPLLAIPTREEIFTALSSMNLMKAPGLDGMPTLFYKTYWPIVNDLLLCGRETRKEARAFLECLHTYSSWSGQKVNEEKSNVYFRRNLPGNKARELTQVLGFKPLRGQGRYLGLLFIFSHDKAKDFKGVIERVQNKLSGWKARCLSRAGRDVLAKLVGMAILVYTLMSVPVPKSTCSRIDSVIRDFWWGFSSEKSHLYLKIVECLLPTQGIGRTRLSSNATS